MTISKDDLNQIKGAMREVAEDIASKQIEEFAGMVASGFNGVTKQFEQVNERFDKIDETLEDHTDRLGRIETRQQVDQARLDNHDGRIRTLEKAA